MALLGQPEGIKRHERHVGFFRLNTTFLEQLLDLPPNVRIVDVKPNGDCSLLEIRVAGESVPERGSGWCLSPQVYVKHGVADDGTKISQLFFREWEYKDPIFDGK